VVAKSSKWLCGNFHPQALQAIREEMSSGRELEATMRVKLARIALDANASRLAREVLTPAIAQLDRLEELEGAFCCP
jgi:hypothetical protein